MRLIHVKLKPEVSAYLSKLSRTFSVQDYGFTEDLFLALKAQGRNIPTPAVMPQIVADEMKRTKRSKLGVLTTLNKRRQLIMAVLSSRSIQKEFKKKNPTPPLELLNMALSMFRQIYSMIRASQCQTCSLLNNCSYGQQYGNRVQDITKVIDAGFEKEVHKDCPLLPDITAENQIAQSVEFMQTINAAALAATGVSMGTVQTAINENEEAAAAAEEAANKPLNVDLEDDEDDLDVINNAMKKGAGKTGTFDVNDTVGILSPMSDALIQKLSVANLVLYQLALRFDAALEANKGIDYKPTQETMKEKKQRHIESVSDVTKIGITEHIQENEVFEKKLVNKELIKRQDQEPDDKKQLLYVLVDVSGSMTSQFSNQTAYGPVLSCAAVSAALTIALINKVKRDEGIMFLRRFGGAPEPLMYAVLPEEFDAMARKFVTCRYDDGGTDIHAALSAAVGDINGNVKDHISNAEILLITDAEDHLDEKRLRTMLGPVALNVLDVSGGLNKQLEAVADNYFATNKKSTSPMDLLTVVGGKKKVTNAP